MPVRGLLTPSGEWQCDCDPRLPAIWLEVKKNNHNKVLLALKVTDRRVDISIHVRNQRVIDVGSFSGIQMQRSERGRSLEIR
jgi:predicted ATP-dependent Lon-type protease